MSPDENTNTLMEESFPRVSGDEPPRSRIPAIQTPFSPRERG